MDHDETVAALMAELLELTRDVTGGDLVRARRLTVLRRLEECLADGDRLRSLAIAG